MDKALYITRREIAIRTNLNVETIRRFCEEGRLPEPIRRGRFLVYDREEGEKWIKERNSLWIKPRYKPTNEKDVWCIRGKKTNFVYSGRILMHILFCQPALRNGRFTYEDCFK
jgi:predicted DNA-binding transcriptional regulator AlpA